MKKIVLIEDDADLYSLIQYNLEKEGFQCCGLADRQGRDRSVPPRAARPDHSRHHAAGFRRPGDLQRHSRASRAVAHAGHFPDRARLGNRPHRGSGTGRQRLHRQAVLRARTDRPHQDSFPRQTTPVDQASALGDLELDRTPLPGAAAAAKNCRSPPPNSGCSNF